MKKPPPRPISEAEETVETEEPTVPQQRPRLRAVRMPPQRPTPEQTRPAPVLVEAAEDPDDSGPTDWSWIAAVVVGLLFAVVGGALLFLGVFHSGGGDDNNPAPNPTQDGPAAGEPLAAQGTGAYARTVVRADGTVTVQQWVRPARAATSLELKVPDGMPGVKASDVSLSVTDGIGSLSAVEGPKAIASKPVTYEFPSARLIRVEYTLSGAVVESPSKQGRALIRLSSLIPVDLRLAGPSRVDLSGAKVRSAACIRGGAAPAPCGRPIGGGGWLVDIRRTDVPTVVQAQLDLPR